MSEFNVSDPTMEIPNDVGIEGLDPDAIGGSRTPPQPGVYQLVASYPEDLPTDKYFKMGTNAEPTKPVLSTSPNFKIIGAENPVEDQSKWLGAMLFRQYVSTNIMKGNSTSNLTDALLSAGIPKEERAKLSLPGGLAVARNLFLSVVANELPMWAYCSYDWKGQSMRTNPDDPEKKIYVARDSKNFLKVPSGMKSTAESPYEKNEDGLYPTERVYTHVWPDGEEEDIVLHAHLKISGFRLPPKN